MQALESRLRALAAYLADRRRSPRWSVRGAARSPGAASFYADPSLGGVMRGGPGGGNMGSDGITGMPHAKRQRLEDAAKQEEAQCAPSHMRFLASTDKGLLWSAVIAVIQLSCHVCTAVCCCTLCLAQAEHRLVQDEPMFTKQ